MIDIKILKRLISTEISEKSIIYLKSILLENNSVFIATLLYDMSPDGIFITSCVYNQFKLAKFILPKVKNTTNAVANIILITGWEKSITNFLIKTGLASVKYIPKKHLLSSTHFEININ